MKNLGFGKIACIVAAFCVATAVVSIAQTYTTLSAFDGRNGEGPWNSPLVQGLDGNFYGTTLLGGTGGDPSGSCQSNCGTVFRVTPTGQVTTLYNFCSQAGCSDGVGPVTGLTLATSGKFYGATMMGGDSFGDGTIFEISRTGVLTTLYRFCSLPNCTDGRSPQGSIVQGMNGNLYGTTYQGGTNDSGTVFEITPAGKFTTLYSFCVQTNCGDGQDPMGALSLAPSGKIVGTTTYGGTGSVGTVFEISPAGQLSTLFSFPSAITVGGDVANGLILGTDGRFYGTTFLGGNKDAGTIFRLSQSGGYTRAYSFCAQPSCADGDEPASALVQGTDDNFYGTTSLGGTTLSGNIFQITPTGIFTSLYSFCTAAGCSDGGSPYAGLVQGTDGTFYGVTGAGGNRSACIGGCGVIYSLSMGLGPFVESMPAVGKAGSQVAILGNNLTGSTSVTFNGTPATFSVISSTFIKATVPSGATSGNIEVTTPSGTLDSNTAFHIIP